MPDCRVADNGAFELARNLTRRSAIVSATHTEEFGKLLFSPDD